MSQLGCRGQGTGSDDILEGNGCSGSRDAAQPVNPCCSTAVPSPVAGVIPVRVQPRGAPAVVHPYGSWSTEAPEELFPGKSQEGGTVTLFPGLAPAPARGTVRKKGSRVGMSTRGGAKPRMSPHEALLARTAVLVWVVTFSPPTAHGPRCHQAFPRVGRGVPAQQGCGPGCGRDVVPT